MRSWLLATALILCVSEPASAQSVQPGWIADSRTGCQVWNPGQASNQTVTWVGACTSGLAQGRGVLRWSEDGKANLTVEGEWRDGKQHGRGISTWADGHRYEGEFRDGMEHGRGIVT